jgi:predicted kinase
MIPATGSSPVLYEESRGVEKLGPERDHGEHLQLAGKTPILLIMVGAPGTGKSHLVRLLSQRVPLRLVQTDQIRRRLVSHPTYTQEENRRVFYLAHRQIGRLLRAGENVVFDATNLYERRRRTLYRMAERNGARLLIVRTVAPDDIVAKRLQMRSTGADPGDLSEAGWEVYARMKGQYEEIQRPHLVVDTSAGIEPAIDRIARLIQD